MTRPPLGLTTPSDPVPALSGDLAIRRRKGQPRIAGPDGRSLLMVGFILLITYFAYHHFCLFIPDSRLRAVVAEAEGFRTPGLINSKARLREVETISASGAGISSLQGLQHATNLHELDLSNQPAINGIDSYRGIKAFQLAPLYNLENLVSLDLSYNGFRVDRASGLGQLEQLEVLDLSGSRIQSFDALSELRHLRVLRLRDCEISSWQGVEKLEGLQEFYLGEYQSVPMAKLAQLTELEVLSINIASANAADNRRGQFPWPRNTQNAVDLSPLARLKKLRVLHLVGLGITDVTPLHNLGHLEILDVRYNPIDSGLDSEWLETLRRRN